MSPHPYEITHLFGLPITNAMVTAWLVSFILILLTQLMIGKRGPHLIPSRAQAILETMVEGIYQLLKPIVGARMIKPTFPLLISLFAIILINNWSALLPGVGVFGHYDEQRHLLYYLRPANADLNMTLALSLLSFITWMYYLLRYEGIRSILFHLFGNKANKKDIPLWMYSFLFVLFPLVGLIEIISILFRPVSLAFRLYGNIFGGENLLSSIHGICAYILPVPFYFLEGLIGFIQALVFTLLIAVYIGLLCNHEQNN